MMRCIGGVRADRCGQCRCRYGTIERYLLLALFTATCLISKQLVVAQDFLGGDNAQGVQNNYINANGDRSGVDSDGGVEDMRIHKTVTSSSMRLVFFVGLEGTGHHYVVAALEHLFDTNDKIAWANACSLANELYPGLVGSLLKDPMHYSLAHGRLAQRMERLAQAEKELEWPGTIVSVQLVRQSYGRGNCSSVGMMSYPNFAGGDKVMQYVDLRLLAAAAEAKGVDVRLVYLSRSAEELVISNSQHNRYHSMHKGADYVSQAENFMRYMQILMTSAGVLHSLLSELGPGFLICHYYDRILEEDQATRIAQFVSPTAHVAEKFAESLRKVANPRSRSADNAKNHKSRERLRHEGSKVVIKRLQQKLDVLEAAYCR